MLGVGWLGDSFGVYTFGSGRCNADYMTSWGLLSRNNCGFKVLLKKENYNTIRFA